MLNTHLQLRIAQPQANRKEKFDIFISQQLGLSQKSNAQSTYGAFADFLEDLGAGVLADVVSHFKMTECTGTLGVDDALWNSLAIEVRHLVNEVDILEENWAVDADGLSGRLHANW